MSLAILPDERVPGFGQNANQLVFGQFLQHGGHGQAADKFGNETIGDQILRLDILQHFVAVHGGDFVPLFHRAKAHHAVAQTPLDDLLQAR